MPDDEDQVDTVKPMLHDRKQRRVKSSGWDKVKDKSIELEKFSSGGSTGISSPTTDLPKDFATASRIIMEFPIHNAVQNGNLEQLKTFLNVDDQSANVLFIQDYKLRTPLHYAAGYGVQGTAYQMAEHLIDCTREGGPVDAWTLQKIATFVNTQDRNGDTALHIAAKCGHSKVVQLLINYQADMNVKNNPRSKLDEGVEPLTLIYQYVPEAMADLFDGDIEYQNAIGLEEVGKDIVIHCRTIIGHPTEEEKENNVFQPESYLLAYALTSSEKDSKSVWMHPLVQLFLWLKWRKIRWLFAASIIFHIIWSILYSVFLIRLYLIRCPYLKAVDSVTTTQSSWKQDLRILNNNGSDSEQLRFVCEIDGSTVLLGVIPLVSSILIVLKEVYQIYNMPRWTNYFKHLENYGQILLTLFIILTTLPLWNYCFSGLVEIDSWQYEAAAVGVFLAWVLILGQVGKFPTLGLYVEMLRKVVESFVMFMATFFALMMAFALAFSFVLPKKKKFQSWPWIMPKLIVMMIGELEYDDLFYDENEPLTFPVTAHFLFLLFILLVTIILFNLLIGLTVNDIQGLQSDAELSKTVSTLERIYVMEWFLERVTKILGLGGRFLQKFQIVDLAHEDLKVIIPLEKIPKPMQQAVKDLATKNLQKKCDGRRKRRKKKTCTCGGGESESDKEFNHSLLKTELRDLIKEIITDVLKQQLTAVDKKRTTD